MNGNVPPAGWTPPMAPQVPHRSEVRVLRILVPIGMFVVLFFLPGVNQMSWDADPSEPQFRGYDEANWGVMVTLGIIALCWLAAWLPGLRYRVRLGLLVTAISLVPLSMIGWLVWAFLRAGPPTAGA